MEQRWSVSGSGVVHSGEEGSGTILGTPSFSMGFSEICDIEDGQGGRQEDGGVGAGLGAGVGAGVGEGDGVVGGGSMVVQFPQL